MAQVTSDVWHAARLGNHTGSLQRYQSSLALAKMLVRLEKGAGTGNSTWVVPATLSCPAVAWGLCVTAQSRRGPHCGLCPLASFHSSSHLPGIMNPQLRWCPMSLSPAGIFAPGDRADQLLEAQLFAWDPSSTDSGAFCNKTPGQPPERVSHRESLQLLGRRESFPTAASVKKSVPFTEPKPPFLPETSLQPALWHLNMSSQFPVCRKF